MPEMPPDKMSTAPATAQSTAPRVSSGRAGRDADPRALPLAPRSHLSTRRRIEALRQFHTGQERLRNPGCPVTDISIGLTRMLPPMVLVTSPQGIHDVLARSDAFVEKTTPHEEMRALLGENLFDTTHEHWLPRRRAIQPVFTKQHVRAFGDDMVRAADAVVSRWPDNGAVDLDAECRRLTLRALGRSVLGMNLDDRAEALGEPVRIVLTYISDRALRPVRAPRRLPTPARRRARAAATTLNDLAAEVLHACRRDTAGSAPLVRALLSAADPETGEPLSDEAICNELVVFLGAGFDTTATALGYALWALGNHPHLQERVEAEVAAFEDRDPTPADLPHLGYTVQVLQEALRLCPPAAAIPRMALQDIAVDGHRVPAGTYVVAGIFAVHRDPQLWDNPMAFDPDRFGPAHIKAIDRWQYLPFGAGPRSCIGDHFAMLELTLALATIIRKVEVVALHADFPMAVPFTMVAAEPIPARIRWRRTTG